MGGETGEKERENQGTAHGKLGDDHADAGGISTAQREGGDIGSCQATGGKLTLNTTAVLDDRSTE